MKYTFYFFIFVFMKNFAKKIVAIISLISIATIYMPANAADSSATLSTWNIVVTDTRFNAGQDVNNLTVYVDNVSIAVGELAITEDALTIDSASDYVWAEEVQYIFADGTPSNNFVWATIVQGSTGHQVEVSATVLPYLTMTIDNTAIDFGALTLGSDNLAGTDTEITIDSNAQEWFNVVASFSQLTHTDTTTTLDFKLNTDEVAPLTASGSDVTTGNTVIDQVGYSSTGVTAQVSYIASPASNQKSWNYSTTVTYNVTWSF